MQSIIERALAIALAVVIAVCASRPMTWRMDLVALEYSILKDVRRTDNWGNPSIFKGGHRAHQPNSDY